MWKSCTRCGRLHASNQKCPAKKSPTPKTQDQKLRSTNKWTKKSKEIRKASKWLCEICLEEGRYNYEDLEVHHITKLRDNEAGLLDNYNLVCLCKHHHELADAGKISAEHLQEIAKSREDAEYAPL